MNYCFDLDGTICDTPLRKEDLKPGYLESVPFPYMVDKSIDYMMRVIKLLL